MNQPLRYAPLAPLLLGLGACGWVVLGDALAHDMTPQQAAACRQVVAEEIARQGIASEQVRRIHYQRMTPRRRSSKGQNKGYEAWVYPKKEGPGALIIELSPSCEVRGAHYYTGPPEETD
ncbi:MAG: hypothetical protein R3285_02260 [Kiloniellales bacterium]|nr:hypothetical protein [Kiloniellales bacterium]